MLGSMKPANLNYVVLAKNAAGAGRPTLDMLWVATGPVAITARQWFLSAWGHAPLRRGIRHVVGVRSQKQVLGIDTRWIVAAMANTHARRDRTVNQFPGNPMASSECYEFPADVGDSVAPSVFGASPEPAVARLVYSAPEPGRQWLRFRGQVRPLARYRYAQRIYRCALAKASDDRDLRTGHTTTGTGDGGLPKLHG